MKKLVVLLTCLFAVSWAAVNLTCALAQALAQGQKKAFRVESLGGLGAGGLYVTSVNKAATPSPSSGFGLQTLSKTFTSSTVGILDQTVSSGSASGIMTATGSGSMQMLYAYSTTLDGTLTLFNSTYGTGSTVASTVLTAGVPYEWDSATSGTSSLILSPSNSITFTPGTTAGGVGTSTTATTINAAAMYP